MGRQAHIFIEIETQPVGTNLALLLAAKPAQLLPHRRVNRHHGAAGGQAQGPLRLGLAGLQQALGRSCRHGLGVSQCKQLHAQGLA